MQVVMKKQLILVMALCLLPLGSLLAQAVNYKAHSLFLFNFARYTEWPASTADSEVIRFGVLGKSDVVEELNKILKGKTINGKRCQVEKITNATSPGFYHIIFVADSESGQLLELLKTLGDQPTLVVTERENLVKKGAAISFLISDEQKLQFQLNNEVISKINIQMASSLKGLAQVIR